jgi:hypothetical protein
MLHISRFLSKKEVEMALSSHKISHLTLTQPAGGGGAGGGGMGDVTIEGKKKDMSRKRELLRLLFFMKLYNTHCLHSFHLRCSC